MLEQGPPTLANDQSLEAKRSFKKWKTNSLNSKTFHVVRP
jgi:hypothetical protein